MSVLGHDEPDDFYNTLEYFGLDSVIASLPNGINTSVDNHNFNLSAGEKQKIAIVRTIIKGGCVLIFDEPTSALDTLTRDRFLAYLQNHKKNKMVIMDTAENYVPSIAATSKRGGAINRLIATFCK